jgi:hypothetical protein
MSTILPNLFSVNGVIDTNKSIMENLNTLGAAAGAWVTFDTITGQWAVIINNDSATVKTFTDSDMVGPISISGKGLEEFYSSVQFEYPHQDLNDEKDVVIVSVDAAELYPGESPNTLNYTLDVVNNPTQIQYLAGVELKQNRLDRILKFSTDFSSLGLKAGDVIEINTDKYGSDVFEGLKWRITQIQEEDTDDGQIVLSITAMEHNSDIYSTAGLTREQRTINNGITYEDSSTEIADNRSVAGVENTTKGLLLPLATSAALRFANSLFNKKNIEEGILPKGFQVSAINGSYNTTTLAPNTWYDEFYTEDFTPQFTGSYIGQFLFDQNNSGARGGVNDTIAFAVEIFDSTGSSLVLERSGGVGTRSWDDYFLGARVNLIADETYTIKLSYINDTVLGGNLSVNASWNIFAASSSNTVITT